MKKLFLFLFLFSSHFIFSQGKWEKKFEQLGTLLPTPNNYRSASGTPGKDYWQQRADYDMKIFLDDENQGNDISNGVGQIHLISFVVEMFMCRAFKNIL